MLLGMFSPQRHRVPRRRTEILKSEHYLMDRKAQPMNEIEQDILKLEEELTQTETRLDVDALDSIYADDIMVTAPIGICVDKPAVMIEIRQAAEKAVVGRYDKDDLKVRAFGD